MYISVFFRIIVKIVRIFSGKHVLGIPRFFFVVVVVLHFRGLCLSMCAYMHVCICAHTIG